jgi:hypothetical protein
MFFEVGAKYSLQIIKLRRGGEKKLLKQKNKFQNEDENKKKNKVEVWIDFNHRINTQIIRKCVK